MSIVCLTKQEREYIVNAMMNGVRGLDEETYPDFIKTQKTIIEKMEKVK